MLEEYLPMIFLGKWHGRRARAGMAGRGDGRVTNAPLAQVQVLCCSPFFSYTSSHTHTHTLLLIVSIPFNHYPLLLLSPLYSLFLSLRRYISCPKVNRVEQSLSRVVKRSHNITSIVSWIHQQKIQDLDGNLLNLFVF